MLKEYFKTDVCIGLEKSRAYYVPFQKGQLHSSNREDSFRFQSLNGTWKIEEFESILDADNFWQQEGQKEITVPSVVQFYGFDYFQYTNIRYPFPFNPPNIPSKNPAYHYSRNFTWSGNEKAYLIFEGVDSCFYLYVNGKFVGFSQISHRISEFDVTKYLASGENKIDVLVLKWCFGSYLEDQDKFRYTGIFRDVYLLKRPKNHIEDYKIETEIIGKKGVIKVKNLGTVEFLAILCDQKKAIKPNEVGIFNVKNPKLWSAEVPNLYDLQLTCGEEVIFEKVGICSTKVVDGVYLFNGKPIKFYGVNRHDCHPKKGPAVSKEDMEADIKLMKALNVNAVRTSHYPSSPLFYQMCNEYGLYVMSETDIESHGSTVASDEANMNKNFCVMAEDKRFLNSVLDREICNVQEHKNFPCVVMWSMGNESGWGNNYVEALKEIRKLDSRPIHYESLWNYDRQKYGEEYFYTVDLDVVGRMYISPEYMLKGYYDKNGKYQYGYLDDPNEKRPLVLCEYGHAMGNGPGGLKDYWEVIESSPRFVGGFIWEWADHGVRYLTNELRYGGDFGEYEHDSNFCMDGIVSSDRQIKSGTLSMKKVYQPLKITLRRDFIVVLNKQFFASFNGEIKIIEENEERNIEVNILPRKSIKIPINGKNVKILCFANKMEVAREQFYSKAKSLSTLTKSKVDFAKEGGTLKVKVNDSLYYIDLTSGLIKNIMLNGESYGKIQLNLWRAPTDNDKNISWEWDDKFLRFAFGGVENVAYKDNKITFSLVVGVSGYKPFMNMKLSYSFYSEGVRINVNYQLIDNHYFTYLPRIGFKWELDKDYKKLKYLAYGPQETYSDLVNFAFKDVYESQVDKEYYNYPRPQESGSHWNSDWVEISNNKNTIRAEGMASFSAIPYSQEDLFNAKHPSQLPTPNKTYLNLDIATCGLGSNSCGPLPFEKYKIKPKASGEIAIIFKKDN